MFAINETCHNKHKNNNKTGFYMRRKMKSLTHMFRKKCQDRQKDNLVNHMSSEYTEPAEENSSQQNGCLEKTTDEFDRGKDALTESKYTQDLKRAIEQVRHWKNQNGITPDGYGVSTSYSQSKMKDYLKIVETFVMETFSALPINSQQPIEEYLNDANSSIFSNVVELVTHLEDSELVEYLLDSFNRHLFDMLHLLVDRTSTVKDSTFLLQWVKKKYFSQDHNGCLLTQNDVLTVSDPFLLADWLEYSKHKHLTLLQDEISTTLHNILQHDSSGSSDYRNEEIVIQVQLDVIQCLNAHIQASETISHTLKNAVQRLCCNELHQFIKSYVDEQGPDGVMDFLCHFKRLYTCRKLRFYAMSIIDKNNDTDSSTLFMLENMETLSLSSAQLCFEQLARDHLKKYFNNEDEQLHNLIVTILKMLATLPQVEQEEETKQLIVKAAYHSVTRAYLQCLIQKKYKKLERRWTDVGKKIIWDAEHLHFNFAKHNGSDDDQKMLLLTIGEILRCQTVDTLKLHYAELYNDFHEESEAYIPPLLHWRGVLSRRQIKEVTDVRNVIEDIRYGGHVRSYRHMHWCCCLC